MQTHHTTTTHTRACSSSAYPQTVATEAHVRQALELFKISTMDAVKSGLMDVAVFTDEQRWVAGRAAQGWRARQGVGAGPALLGGWRRGLGAPRRDASGRARHLASGAC